QRNASIMMTCILLLAALAQAPSTVSGVVTDVSGLAMSGVTITATSGTIRESARTAPDGSWNIALPASVNTVTLRVAAPAYAAQQRDDSIRAAARIDFRTGPGDRGCRGQQAVDRKQRDIARSLRACGGAGTAPRRSAAHGSRLQSLPPDVLVGGEPDDAGGDA